MNDQNQPATSLKDQSTSTDLRHHTKQALVIYSDSSGLYLGSCVDIRFWTMLDRFSLHTACTFPNEAAARAHVDAWKLSAPTDIRLVPVTEDEPGFASMAACIVAGLPFRKMLPAPDSAGAKLFFSQLLNSVETLGGIADQYGSRTLADLMYLQNAIANGSSIDHYLGESAIVEVVRQLPDATRWLKYVSVENRPESPGLVDAAPTGVGS